MEHLAKSLASAFVLEIGRLRLVDVRARAEGTSMEGDCNAGGRCHGEAGSDSCFLHIR